MKKLLMNVFENMVKAFRREKKTFFRGDSGKGYLKSNLEENLEITLDDFIFAVLHAENE